MSKKKPGQIIAMLHVCFITLALAACTHVFEVPEAPVTGYQATEKIDLPVTLHLSEALYQAKWERHVVGDTYRIPLGESLAQNAETLARQLFSQVVLSRPENNPSNTKSAAILTPKMILAERTSGATAFGVSILTIMLEWTLQDTNGNIIWVDTIRGVGRARSGNVFTFKKNARHQIQMALQNLFHNSFQALSSSPEIRKFAASHRQISARQ